jgi:cation transport ATPase
MAMYYSLMEKLIKYREFINIITIILLLLLPLPNGKFTLVFFMAIFLALYQFAICLNQFEFSTMWIIIVQALLGIIYIVISVTVVLNSLYIIKGKLSAKMDMIFSIFILIAGLYSLYAILKYPSMFSFGWGTLFFIFNTLRWILQLKKTKSD